MHQPSLDTPSCRFIPAHCNRDFSPIDLGQSIPGQSCRSNVQSWTSSQLRPPEPGFGTPSHRTVITAIARELAEGLDLWAINLSVSSTRLPARWDAPPPETNGLNFLET